MHSSSESHVSLNNERRSIFQKLNLLTIIYCVYISIKCDLSAKPAPKGTLRYIHHSITSPVPALSKTDLIQLCILLFLNMYLINFQTCIRHLLYQTVRIMELFFKEKISAIFEIKKICIPHFVFQGPPFCVFKF